MLILFQKRVKKVILPDSSKIKEFATYVVFDEQRIWYFLKDYNDLLDDIIMPFGTGGYWFYEQ